MKPRALLLGGVIAAVALPATAGASTKTVFMGPPPVKAITKQFQALNGDDNAFFPALVTVHVGDKVSFVPLGFHTLDLPAKGETPINLFSPGDPVSGANDAGGAPFWFNGQPSFGFDPALFLMGFGNSYKYDQSTIVESGLPFGDKPKPINVTFVKKGTFTYYCDVHPGMKGKVHVVAKAAKVPSPKSDAKTVATQAATAIKTLKSVSKFKPGSGTIQIGGAGAHGVESYDFFPASTTVKVGTSVTFKMPPGSTEVHTATAGPGDPEKDPTSYLGALSASFNSPAPSATAMYPSEQPGGTPAALSPTLHGNGFWNSGILDSFGSSPNPPSNVVTFSTAGTYTLYCLIHPFMKTTVTVQ